MNWLTAPRRKALYGLGAALAALAVAYGLIDEETSALWVALVPGILNVLALTRTADPVAVEDTDSPTGESAGGASELPEGTPTETEPAEAEISPVTSEGYVGQHRAKSQDWPLDG